jgi:LysM repeat protein
MLPFSALLTEEETHLTGIINTPRDFLQLLWEASIVRSGGFYLYYETGKDKTGLPDYLFNQKETGDISILVIYKEVNDLLTSYMNCGITGDNIDTANDIIFAEAEAQTVNYTVSNTTKNPDSLESIASKYHIHITDLALQNASQPLNPANSQPLAINNIYHEVGVTASGNTEKLAAIASYFGITETAIKAANPALQIDWDNIPVFTLLRIPDIQYQVTANGQLKTLVEVADYYDVSIPCLGWDNRHLNFIFATNTKLSIEDWIVDKTATLPPGNVGFTLELNNPGDNDDPAFYLLRQYNLLGYQIAENISFKMSNEALPAGPANQLDRQGIQDAVRQQPRLAESTQPWQYQQVFPVYPFAKFNPLEGTNNSLPDPNLNPYAGVGEVLQVHFAWQDLFGNQTITSLSEPKLAPDQPLNNLPISIGYTDKLLALAQWPSVMVNYIFQMQNEKKSLVINLEFDPSRYQQNNQPTSNSSNPDDLPTWQKNALADRLIYSQLYYQISQTDKQQNPTVHFAVQTSLDRNQQRILNDDNLTKIKDFIIAAYQYLSGLLPDGIPTSAPAGQQLLLEIDDSNPDNIFELTVLFSIQRQEQQIADDFKDAASFVSAQTYLSPLTKNPKNASDDGNGNGEEDTHKLTYFAEQFETTYRFDHYYLKIAVGMSRFDAADSQESKTIWVVRLATDASNTLYYQIQGEAIFYAPRPLSNSLISRTVPIINYDDFDPSKPLREQITQSKAFAGVDVDVWARQALAAIDLFLSPQFVIPAFIVDKLSNPNTTYFKTVLNAKGKLADAIVTTVYNILDNPEIDPNSNNLKDAREKLRQQLLIELANVYEIEAIVQYNRLLAKVLNPSIQNPKSKIRNRQFL